MKKFLFLGALAALLLGTASCSNDMEPQLSDGTVQFKVELPGAIDSRAISDGTTAIKLDVACYDAEGNVLNDLNPVVSEFSNRVATVTVKLVKGQTYNFAFFAHADGAPYAFDAGATLADCKFTVTDNYTGDACLSNAENRDAFYAVLTDYAVTPETTEVTLYRPFAQLNFGANDLAAAAAAGITPSQSMVTVKQVATSFNLSTGLATADGAVDATFNLAAIPTEKLTVDGTEYDWMAMNYFLVPANEANVDVKMTVKTNKADVEVPVTSVPVKKNHRTNIVGSLFTQEGKFNVVIEPIFDTPDYNVNYPEITDVVYWNNQEFETIEAAYNAAITAGQTDIVISLAKGTYTIDNNFAFENPNKVTNVTVQAASGVSASDVIIDNSRFSMCASSYQRVASGSKMTIKGISFTTNTNGATNNEGGDNGAYYHSWSNCIYTQGDVILTVEDCIFNIKDETETAIFTWGSQGGSAVVKNCVFNCEKTGKPIAFGNGHYNAVENCTFNQPKKYALQVNHYSSSDPVSQLIFKNNTINANPSKINYGLALDSRQEAYYNLNITVENNVMNNPYTGSVLYAHSNDPAIWETVTVNNSRDDWGIYVP